MTPLAILTALLPSVPSIAKMLGMSDNVGEVAKTVSSVVKQFTGDDTNEDALTALRNDPEKLLALQLAMMDKEKEFERMYSADKSDARYRDAEFIKQGKRNWRADGLVLFSCTFLVSILLALLFAEPSEYAKGAITMVLGFLINQLANVFSFEFGTTRKDDENNKSILADYIKSTPK